MRTTLTIDSVVLAEFKRQAAESHRTLSALIEAALREHLGRQRDDRGTKPLDFPIVGGGGLVPGVDLDTNAHTLDYIDRAEGVYERFGTTPRPAPPNDSDRCPGEVSGAH